MNADILSTTDCAKLFECSEASIEIAARAGMLPGLKFGHGWVFPKAALLDEVNRQATADMKKRRAAPVPQSINGVLVEVAQAGRKAANNGRMRPRPTLEPMPELPGVAGR